MRLRAEYQQNLVSSSDCDSCYCCTDRSESAHQKTLKHQREVRKSPIQFLVFLNLTRLFVPVDLRLLVLAAAQKLLSFHSEFHFIQDEMGTKRQFVPALRMNIREEIGGCFRDRTVGKVTKKMHPAQHRETPGASNSLRRAPRSSQETDEAAPESGIGKLRFDISPSQNLFELPRSTRVGALDQRQRLPDRQVIGEFGRRRKIQQFAGLPPPIEEPIKGGSRPGLERKGKSNRKKTGDPDPIPGNRRRANMPDSTAGRAMMTPIAEAQMTMTPKVNPMTNLLILTTRKMMILMRLRCGIRAGTSYRNLPSL
ncbi:hypothetical protein R1flu_022193 [Riccia fluitans]|uniref:Uncharacterized protein n=1 Tax=Riccia fluitans TaxID=41844 RepID=A0ABD1ZSN0_9MARC